MSQIHHGMFVLFCFLKKAHLCHLPVYLRYRKNENKFDLWKKRSSILKEGNKNITNDAKLCEAFNTSFSNVVASLNITMSIITSQQKKTQTNIHNK